MHIFLVNRQQTQAVAVSVDTEVFGIVYELPTASNPIAQAQSQKSQSQKLELPPNSLALADAAMSQVWSCYLGIVHTVYCVVRCRFLERLPPPMSQLWFQDFKTIALQCLCKDVILKS